MDDFDFAPDDAFERSGGMTGPSVVKLCAMSFSKKLCGQSGDARITRTIAIVPGEYDAVFQVTVTDLTRPGSSFISPTETEQPGKWFSKETDALAYAKEQVDASVKSGLTLC